MPSAADATAQRLKLEEAEQQRRELVSKWSTAIDGKWTSLISNVQCGLRTTQELVQRIKHVQKVAAAYGKSVSESAKETPGTTEWSSALRGAWVAAFQVPTRLGEQAVARSEALNDLVKRASSLQSDLQKFEERLASDAAKLARQVEDASQTMGQAAAASLKATAEAEAAAESKRPVKVDSWLLECRYRAALAALIAAQTKQKEALVAASQEAQKLEQQRVETSRRVLAEWLQGEKKAMMESAKAIDAALNLVGLVDPADDALKFSSRVVHNVIGPPPAPAPATAAAGAKPAAGEAAGAGEAVARAAPVEPPAELPEALVNVLESAMVEKHGMLRRQAAIIKIWKENYFVLSRNGWLHYFGKAGDLEPEESVPLHEASVAMSDASISEFCFDLHAAERGEGFFSRDKSWHLHLKAASEEQMVEWVISIRKLAKGDTAPPS